MFETTILLVPGAEAGLLGAGFAAALRVDLGFLWTPPTGAVVAGRPPVERRADPTLRPDVRRWVERISSRDLSSLLADMVKVGERRVTDWRESAEARPRRDRDKRLQVARIGDPKFQELRVAETVCWFCFGGKD